MQFSIIYIDCNYLLQINLNFQIVLVILKNKMCNASIFEAN